MKRLKTGDIFEIETNKGKGYFQCVDSDKLRGELIRVYYSLYENRPDNIDTIINSDFYYIGFPLKMAIRKKVVSYVGNKRLNSDFKKPRYFREKHVIRGDFKGWLIVDSETNKMKLEKKLSKEQKLLSPTGIANDTYIIERFEEGWRLEEWV